MLLRPVDKLLVLADLHYATEIREPAIFEEEFAGADYKPQELDMAKQLTEGLRLEKFDLADYPDVYQRKLHELVEAKAKGQELVAPPEEAAPQVINLMGTSSDAESDCKGLAAFRAHCAGELPTLSNC